MFRRAEILPGSPTLYVMIFHSAGEALIPRSKRNNRPATSTWPRHPLPAADGLGRRAEDQGCVRTVRHASGNAAH